MAVQPLGAVVQHLRKLASAQTVQRLPDGQLLCSFIVERDEAAFGELVNRHGRLVLSVCRQVLRQEQDAEDAFQATFLILAKKAESIRNRDSLASWLYGVAYRTARKAKISAAKQSPPMNGVPPMPPPEPPHEVALRELQELLHEEVNRLPEKLRAPFVLCCLEGKSQAEAARQLGWPGGTVGGRLAQARERLRQRLARRGVTLSAVLGASALSSQAASAAVPAALADTTIHAALLLITGKAIGTVSAQALSLALGATALSHLKSGGSSALAVVILATGIGLAAGLYRPGPAVKVEPKRAGISLAGAGDFREPGRAGTQGTTKAGGRVLSSHPGRPHGPEGGAEGQVRTDLYGDPLPTGAVARLGTARCRQGTYIGQSQLAFTPEGNIWTAESSELVLHINNKRSLTGERYAWNSERPEPVLHLWDRASGKELRRTMGPKGSQVYFLTSQAGRILAVGGADEAVQLWEAASGKVLHQLRVSKNTRPVALAADGKVLVTNDIDPASPYPAKTIRLWEVATGLPAEGGGCPPTAARELATVETLDQYLRGPAFSADGKMFLTGWARPDSPMKVWDTASGKELLGFVVKDHNQYCWRWAAFSPDGKILALAAAAHGILLWDLSAGKEIRRIPTEKFMMRIVYSPNGEILAGQDCDSNLYLWDAGSGKELRRLKDDGDYPCWELAFSPDGRTLATWGKTNAFVLWDVASGKRMHPFEGTLSPPRSLAFGPGGKALVAETWYQEDAPVWDVTAGKLLRRLTGHSYGVSAATVSPDGAMLATGSWDGKIRLWDLNTGKQLRQMAADAAGYVGPISFSPDGTMVISTGFEAKLRFFEVATGKEISPPHRPPTPEGLVLWFASSPGSGIMALIGSPRGENTIRLWNPATGKELFRIPNSAGSWAAFSRASGAGTFCFAPDGKTLAAVIGNPPDQTIGIWELATGRERCRLRAPARGISAIAFSPDGKLLALGGYDQMVHIVEVATGKELSRSRGHSGWVLCLSFSPDGKTLASGSGDTTILVWRLSELIGEKGERPSAPLVGPDRLHDEKGGR